jgi:acyl-CoA synthetase (AMP-forming)/AMP-acid ligase II/acetyltransferase-like isoleucine patch superfamily enzyme
MSGAPSCSGTIAAALHANAARDDGGEFLRLVFPGAPDRVLAYAELMAEAGRWTRFFAEHGLGRGDRVIVVLPHSVDLYAAYVGALLGAHVPAMFAYPSAKLSEELYFATVGRLIAGSGARLLVTYVELRDKLRAREAAAVARVTLATPEDVQTGPALPESAAAAPGDIAFLQYSSGTTGVKKGVALSHRALLWQVAAYADAIGIRSDDRIVNWLPLYHDMGLIAAFFLPLVRKVPVVAMSPLDWVRRPGMWLQAVTRHRGTLSWMPNFAFNFLARSVATDDLAGVDLSSLRGLVNCSEPVMAHSHDVFLARFAPLGFRPEALAVSYAMAENTFAVTSGGFGRPTVVDHVDVRAFEELGECRPAPAGAPGSRAIVSSGRPLAETEIEVVDSDGALLPARHVGEIVIASPCLMDGYDGGDAAIAGSPSKGRFRTGDLGYVADGEVFVTGRAKDLIIIGGRNIYPQDIEAAVSQVSGVMPGRCVAFGIADESAGTERLIVLAESEADAVAHGPLKAAIYAAVAGLTEVVPGDIRIMPPRQLVKSSSGKISRSANRDRYLEGTAVRPASIVVSPTSPDDSVLARVRSVVRNRLTAIPGIDIAAVTDTTPLITSGLVDSFTLAELLIALESATGRVLTPARLRETRSIDSIAAIAAAMSDDGAAPAIAAPPATNDVPMTYPTRPQPRRMRGLWSAFYRALFRWKGIACGPGLQVLGPLILQIDGDARRIRMGANVTLMPGVHLKNRENGSIVLHDGVKLDTMVRLVAANDAVLELGENVAFGMGTVVNAGMDVRVGRGALSSMGCMINASDHRMDAGLPIREQAFVHAPILIGEDVFLGAHCYVAKGSRIGNGAVVSVNAAVTGDVPPGAIVQGSPARVVKYRM